MGSGSAERVSVKTDSDGKVELGTINPNTSKPFLIVEERYPRDMQCINVRILTENISKPWEDDVMYEGSL